MKKPASFQMATIVTQASAVSLEPSQLCEAPPNAASTCASNPYCGV